MQLTNQLLILLASFTVDFVSANDCLTLSKIWVDMCVASCIIVKPNATDQACCGDRLICSGSFITKIIWSSGELNGYIPSSIENLTNLQQLYIISVNI